MRVFFAASLVLSTLVFARAVEPEAVLPAAVGSVKARVHRNPRADLRMSNAKRLAMGRPLRRPRQFRAAQLNGITDALVSGPGPDPNAAPVANTPTPCVPSIIRVGDDTDATLGYLAESLDASGVFSTLVKSPSDPSVLTICVNSPDESSQLSDIHDEGSAANSTLPYLGAVVAFDRPYVSWEHGEYVYLALVAQTPPNSPAVEDPDNTGNSFNEATGMQKQYESNVFSVNGLEQLSVVWSLTTPSSPETMTFGRLAGGEIVAAPGPGNVRARGIEFQDLILTVTPIQ